MNFYITVNNREIEAVKGETVLQALKRNGITVPTLCNMEGFTPTGACRLCMVEVKGKADLMPACSYPVEEWMEVQTHTARVTQARRVIVELLLAGHPDDCLYCERNCHCELQNLAYELNIRERKHKGHKVHKIKDLSSPAILRDPSKCILCGRCVRVCEEVIGCTALEFSSKGNQAGITTTCGRNMNLSTCITCGQCVLVCPTSALYEKKHLSELQQALNHKERYPVAVIDPVVTLTLADMYGYRNVRQAARQLNAILKRCGFQQVYDYAAVQDLYVTMGAEEVINGNGRTILSSNCPAWVKFCEQQMQDQIPHLSALKSPSQIAGTIIKSRLNEELPSAEPPLRPYVVSITPCTARKFELKRKEFSQLPGPDVDLAITTRALDQLIRIHGLDLSQVETEDFTPPFHTASLHGEMGGVAGGTMEAMAAAVYQKITEGEELNDPKIRKQRASKGVREISFTVKKNTYRFAAVSGMAEAEQFIRDAASRSEKWNYIEVMACPGGCVEGGGQPIMESGQSARSRQKQMVEMAEKNALTGCYRNRSVLDIASSAEYMGKPLEELLCTHYNPRNVY